METLAISFIDYGDTRGSFTWSLGNALVNLKDQIDITHVLRATGPNIAGNRNYILKDFIQETDADWLMCIDTDIVFIPEQLEMLWNTKSEERQVVSGVYFIIMKQTNVSPLVLPAIFKPQKDILEEDQDKREFWHPLPENQIVEIGRAGFGFLLISRKVIEQVLSLGLGNPFEETHKGVNEIVGEDFAFFQQLNKLNIKSYANTGIIVNHDKYFQISADYYRFFWKHMEPLMGQMNV